MVYKAPRLWDGRVAFDPRDDWLIALANEKHAENERLRAELAANACLLARQKLRR